jgi:hypothetical protein
VDELRWIISYKIIAWRITLSNPRSGQLGRSVGSDQPHPGGPIRSRCLPVRTASRPTFRRASRTGVDDLKLSGLAVMQGLFVVHGGVVALVFHCSGKAVA